MYTRGDELVASVAGIVERVNKLVSVRPLYARYTGVVGDVVVGRVKEVGTRRWKVDINARQDAILMLSSVNLTGGVQRRRTTEDQMHMRSYFTEHDLVSVSDVAPWVVLSCVLCATSCRTFATLTRSMRCLAWPAHTQRQCDVHSIFSDGAVSLHARSLKFGKLENGQVIVVPPALIKRLKQHFVTLPCRVDVILGNNGYIWMTETFAPDKSVDKEGVDAGIVEAVEERQRQAASRRISREGRLRVARVRNAISMLSSLYIVISPTTIMDVYDSSVALGLDAKDMLNPDNVEKLVARARETVAGAAGAL